MVKCNIANSCITMQLVWWNGKLRCHFVSTTSPAQTRSAGEHTRCQCELPAHYRDSAHKALRVSMDQLHIPEGRSFSGMLEVHGSRSLPG